jgi:hypothetical protein
LLLKAAAAAFAALRLVDFLATNQVGGKQVDGHRFVLQT